MTTGPTIMTRMRRSVLAAGLGALCVARPAAGHSPAARVPVQTPAPESFAAGSPAPLVDNDRVTVWKGTAALPPPAGDFVWVPPLENRSGYPAAFPRPGVTKALDNERVLVWDYSWKPGEPTPMHFHDKDVVVTYVAEGALKSTTPDGQSTTNEFWPGTVRFNARDRVHTEVLARGQGRAIIVELK